MCSSDLIREGGEEGVEEERYREEEYSSWSIDTFQLTRSSYLSLFSPTALVHVRLRNTHSLQLIGHQVVHSGLAILAGHRPILLTLRLCLPEGVFSSWSMTVTITSPGVKLLHRSRDPSYRLKPRAETVTIGRRIDRSV